MATMASTFIWHSDKTVEYGIKAMVTVPPIGDIFDTNLGDPEDGWFSLLGVAPVRFSLEVSYVGEEGPPGQGWHWHTQENLSAEANKYGIVFRTETIFHESEPRQGQGFKATAAEAKAASEATLVYLSTAARKKLSLEYRAAAEAKAQRDALKAELDSLTGPVQLPTTRRSEEMMAAAQCGECLQCGDRRPVTFLNVNGMEDFILPDKIEIVITLAHLREIRELPPDAGESEILKGTGHLQRYLPHGKGHRLLVSVSGYGAYWIAGGGGSMRAEMRAVDSEDAEGEPGVSILAEVGGETGIREGECIAEYIRRIDRDYPGVYQYRGR